MPAVDECEGGAASAADMIAMVEAGTVQPPPWMANGGRRGQVSAFGMKAVQRGVHSAHRGECRPSGCGRSARTSPMLGTKPSTGGIGGEWRPTWTKFPHLGRKPSREALIQLTGANAAHEVVSGLWRSARKVFAFGAKTVRRGVYLAPRGKCRPWSWRWFTGRIGAPVAAILPVRY